MWLNCFTTFDFRERIYAKERWLVWFNVKAFDLPYYDSDTIIYVSWKNVDSINYPEIKDSLKKIENDYGNYIMQKTHPDVIQPGSGQEFRITFDNYVNGVELEKKFNAIPYANCDFISGIYYIEDIDDYSQNWINNVSLYPNPASEYIEINIANVVEPGLRPVSTEFSEEIRVYNALGECVKNPTPDLIHTPAPLERGIREGVLRIDVSDLPAGIYFIRIGDAVKSFVKI
jgi:hypothetical protein